MASPRRASSSFSAVLDYPRSAIETLFTVTPPHLAKTLLQQSSGS